ncbi:MAG TPA: rhomboid family intramembrane serine protease, partial [Fimbriimonas sp.]|nr:rhomboid family intramembrane serine protease [Fimbriimonas sp.]
MLILPYRNQNPPESWPIATILLIVFNTTFFILTSKFGLVAKQEVVMEYGVSLANFHWYQLITSMFLHGDLMHLLGNMFFLYLMGFAVEGRLRTWKFLILYFVAGLAGSALHLLIAGPSMPKIPAIGASGAIMGVMGASMYMFPHSPVDVFWWIFYRVGTVEWRMWHVGLMYICFDLLDIFLEIASGTPGGTANFAHLGGVAAGALVCLIMRAVRDDEVVSHAKATLHATNDVSLLHEKELRDLYAVNPTRPDVALHWMVKSSFTDQRNTTYPEAVKAFHAQFNGILDTQPMHLVCQVVNAMLMTNPQLISIQ